MEIMVIRIFRYYKKCSRAYIRKSVCIACAQMHTLNRRAHLHVPTETRYIHVGNCLTLDLPLLCVVCGLA